MEYTHIVHSILDLSHSELRKYTNLEYLNKLINDSIYIQLNFKNFLNLEIEIDKEKFLKLNDIKYIAFNQDNIKVDIDIDYYSTIYDELKDELFIRKYFYKFANILLEKYKKNDDKEFNEALEKMPFQYFFDFFILEQDANGLPELNEEFIKNIIEQIKG